MKYTTHCSSVSRWDVSPGRPARERFHYGSPPAGKPMVDHRDQLGRRDPRGEDRRTKNGGLPERSPE